MSNSNTNISESVLQAEILPALKLGLAPLRAMSFTAVSGRPLYYGDSVIVDVVGAGNAAASYSTTFASGNSTATGTSVTIGAPLFSSWHINPFLEGQPTVERFLAHGRENAYMLAKGVMQLILSEFTATNLGDTANDKIIESTANYDTETFTQARKLLRKKGVSGAIAAIHNLDYIAAIEKDAAIKNASAYGGNQLITTGELPPVLGTTPYFTDAFPTAISAENTGVIFTTPQTVAVAIGAAGVDPSGTEGMSGVRTVVVTDPDTGLSFNWRTWVNSDTGVHWGSVYLACGVEFLRKSAVRVVSA